MKAFHFRLEQALRWRVTQLDVEKSRVSLVAKQLHELRAEIEACRTGLMVGAGQLAGAGVTGSSLAAWAGFTEQSRRRIRQLESKAVLSEQELTKRMQAVTEAHRKVRLLEKLRHKALAGWQAELSRELEALAGEFHLIRVQSKDGTGA